MAIQRTILWFGLVSQVIGNPATHVYPANCAPPTGFDNNDTSVTTVDYITLRPIERCCPQCSPCADLGGFCALRWALDLYPLWCDFELIEPCRDYSCKCCIKCGDDKCSPCVETGGECRAKCRSGELEDTTNVCSYYNNGAGCKCCKKCEARSECTNALGLCVTHPDNCEHGQYASTGCCGGCYCCKPVLEPVPGSSCAIKGGYCSDTDECATGYYECFGECTKTTYHNGLRSVVAGYCCIPKLTDNETKPTIPISGFCGIEGDGDGCGIGSCVTNTVVIGVILGNCHCPVNPDPNEETYCWVAFNV